MKQLTPALRRPIVTLADATAFIDELERVGLTWHFEDDPTDCLSGVASQEDATFLGTQRDRLYELEWGKAECPCGYALHAAAVADPANCCPEWVLPEDWRPS